MKYRLQCYTHFSSLAPFAELLRGQSALLKLPFFLDPLFILPQWSSASMANRFPQLHQRPLHVRARSHTHRSTFFLYNVRLSHIPWHNNTAQCDSNKLVQSRGNRMIREAAAFHGYWGQHKLIMEQSPWQTCEREGLFHSKGTPAGQSFSLLIHWSER